MEAKVHETETVDRIGLSTFTVRIPEGKAQFPRGWKDKSQPAKLLFLGILIMSCLCGTIYYASTNYLAPQERSHAR